MAPRLRKHPEKESGNGTETKDLSPEGKESSAKESSSQSTVHEPPSFKHLWKKVLIRLLLSIGMIIAVYWSSAKPYEEAFAMQKEKIQHKSHEISCSKAYRREVSKFKGCAPKRCGRLVTDVIVSPEEAAHLLQICKKGLAFGGSGGGASVLDLHSGALSQGSSFINIYQKIKASGKNTIFTEQDFNIYRNVRNKIQQMIAFNFGISSNQLHLTHPTFFSEMTARPAKTIHDEYWHVHVDKETYPSFHYTSLLYLTDYGKDFTGGRFTFVDKSHNMTIEPRTGRVSAFTSGSENPHFVEKVTSGTRHALTVSFTCDPNYAIGDPSMAKFH